MPKGTTYYVSPKGDDSSPGTSLHRPWKTLARAGDAALHPGDRLALQGGCTFEGTLHLSERHSGTAERLVRVGSYGRGRAIIAAGVDDYENGEVIFEDNHFVVEGGVPAVHVAPGKTPVHFRRNRYTLRGTSPVALWHGTSYPTVAAWRKATGHEKT